jgi:hypothetical protein
LIAESILPPLGILLIGGIWFRPGPKAGQSVIGRPAPWAFGVIWFALVTMWLIGLVIVACDTLDLASLVLIGVFSLLCIFGCMVWLIAYSKHEHVAAVYGLAAAFACMTVTLTTLLASDTPTDSKVTAGVFFGFIEAWLVLATLFAYLELNR